MTPRKKKFMTDMSKPLDMPRTMNKQPIKFLTENQRHAWEVYQKNEITFLVGPAGTGKSLLATAFAVHDILDRQRERIIICRPIVEAGEHLGFLAGTLLQKAEPYLQPVYDHIKQICGRDSESIGKVVEVVPIAFQRGRNFTNAVCILDEAQNCTRAQLKLFLTRLNEGSKMLITCDPSQSDLRCDRPDVVGVIDALSDLAGIGIVRFDEGDIVRHPIIKEILKRI